MSVCNCMLFVFGPSKSLNQIVFSFFHNSCWVFKGSVSCPLKKMSLCKWSQSELGKVERSKCPWDTFSCHLSIMFQRTYLKSRQRCQMLSNEILRRIAAGRLRLDSWRWLLTIDDWLDLLWPKLYKILSKILFPNISTILFEHKLPLSFACFLWFENQFRYFVERNSTLMMMMCARNHLSFYLLRLEFLSLRTFGSVVTISIYEIRVL